MKDGCTGPWMIYCSYMPKLTDKFDNNRVQTHLPCPLRRCCQTCQARLCKQQLAWKVSQDKSAGSSSYGFYMQSSCIFYTAWLFCLCWDDSIRVQWNILLWQLVLCCMHLYPKCQVITLVNLAIGCMLFMPLLICDIDTASQKFKIPSVICRKRETKPLRSWKRLWDITLPYNY